MNTGECFACKKGYFSDDGICKKCLHGCAKCIDIGYCTTCDKGFNGTYNGKCFRDCQNIARANQFLVGSEDICGFPNGLMYRNTHDCRNVSSGQSYSCMINRYCLMNKACSSDVSDSANLECKNSDGVCHKVMS